MSLNTTEKIFSILSSLVTLGGAAVTVAFWLSSAQPRPDPGLSATLPHSAPTTPIERSTNDYTESDPPFWRRVQIVLIIASTSFFLLTLIDLATGGGLDRAFNGNLVLAIPTGAVVLTTYIGVPIFLLREGYLWFFKGETYGGAYAARTILLVTCVIAGLISLALIAEREKRGRLNRTSQQT